MNWDQQAAANTIHLHQKAVSNKAESVMFATHLAVLDTSTGTENELLQSLGKVWLDVKASLYTEKYDSF